MAKIKVGDKVKIKAPGDWPEPPGYRFSNAQGTVVKWVEYDEAMEAYKDFAYVLIDKAEGEGRVYLNNKLMFRVDSLEKI